MTIFSGMASIFRMRGSASWTERAVLREKKASTLLSPGSNAPGKCHPQGKFYGIGHENALGGIAENVV